MILFWVICALMVVVALAFVLPTLLQRPDDSNEIEQDQKEANVAIYRDQLSELDADLRNGIVSRQQFEQDRDEIERRLLEDTSVVGAATQSTKGTLGKRGVVYALGLALPLLAMTFYLKVGDLKAISQSAGDTASPAASGTAASDFSPPQIEANVASLAKRLETNPSDGPGWSMLARSYSSMEKYAEARDAYAKATALLPNDADLWAEYAFANAMANGRQLQGKSLELVNKALKVDPENLKALELAGSAAFQAKDYKRAIEYWQRLLNKVPPNSEVAESVNKRLEEAKSLGQVK
jgi:cytochrome c-type biogenesis protein CcmH